MFGELSVFAGGLWPGGGGRGVLRRGRGGRAGPGGPAGRQVAGGRRAGRGRHPVPAAGDHPPVRRRVPGRGGRGRAGQAAARRGVPASWRSGNASWRCCSREHDNFRAALDFTLSGGSQAGPRLARALGGFWLARGLFQEAQGWLERALAADPADPRLLADLHRLLGAVLYAAGDLERAQATLAQGLQAAAAAGPARGAGPDPGPAGGDPGRRRAESSPMRSRHARRPRRCWSPKATWRAWPRRGCRSASCVSSVGDPLAPESPGARHRLRAAKRQPPRGAGIQNLAGSSPSGTCPSRPTWRSAGPSGCSKRPPATRGPRRRYSQQLSLLYGFAGRFADARAAYRRGQSIFTASGAKFDWARCAR